jgi:predicted metalloendopeptidase
VIPTLGLTVTQAQTVQTVKEPGINVNYMDKTVKPANDFSRYVNGTWLDNTEIPSDRTRWGSFDELRQKTDADALAILKEAATNPNTNQIQIKARQSFVQNDT